MLNDGLLAYVAGDRSSAFELLKPLAENDVSLAQHFVGRMYSEGFGVQQSCENALYWLKRSATGGNADAAFELGELYEDGRCGPKIASESLAWYQLAAKNGNKLAANEIGEIYLGRGDVAPDFENAILWFSRAAADYNASASCRLGELYAGGYGTKADLVEAYKWFDICDAISLPEQYGAPKQITVMRYAIREKLLPALVSEGQKRALEFMAKWDNRDGAATVASSAR